MLLLTWVYKYLFEILLSIILGSYPELGLMDGMIIVFLIIWGTTILFSTAAAPFYIPTRNVQPHPTNTCYFLFVFFQTPAILIGVAGT